MRNKQTLLLVLVLAGCLVSFLLMRNYTRQFSMHQVAGIVQLELADNRQGPVILAAWQSVPVPDGNLLDTGRILTYYDFFFIFFYVTLLALLSKLQLKKESSSLFRILLRLSIFLMFVAGMLDCIENWLILYNIQRVSTSYISTHWISLIKFLLAGWVILVWLMSLVKELLHSRTKLPAT